MADAESHRDPKRVDLESVASSASEQDERYLSHGFHHPRINSSHHLEHVMTLLPSCGSTFMLITNRAPTALEMNSAQNVARCAGENEGLGPRNHIDSTR